MNISIDSDRRFFTQDPTLELINSPRLHWIDALRGIAAVAVLLSHYYWTPKGGAAKDFFSFGAFGVAVFFCISGFIIPFSTERLTHKPLFSFFISRLFRLYPPYWISIVMAVWAYKVGGQYFSIDQILINVTMIQRFLSQTDVNPVFWTLQVEIVFYAIVAAILAFSALKKAEVFLRMAIFALALNIIFALMRHFLNKHTPLSMTTGVTIMCMSAVYYRVRTAGWKSLRWFIPIAAGMFCVISACWFIGIDRDWGSGEKPFWTALFMTTSYGAGIFLFHKFVLRNKKPHTILSFFGKISYPLYLVHEPIDAIFTKIALPYVGFWFSSMFAIAVSIVVAVIMHRLVELPMIALGRRVVGRPAKA